MSIIPKELQSSELEAEMAHKDQALRWACEAIVDAYKPTAQGNWLQPPDEELYPVTPDKQKAIEAWCTCSLLATKEATK